MDTDQITSIEVPELIRMGDDVVDVAGRLGRVAAGIPGWAEGAQHAVDGSYSLMVVAGAAARGWQTALTALAGEIRDFGDGLTGAAEDYRRADQAAAARLRAAGHPGAPR